MSHKLLSIASFHDALFALDVDFAHSCHRSGCRHCGARLHVSNYARKPRAVPENQDTHHFPSAAPLAQNCGDFSLEADHSIGAGLI